MKPKANITYINYLEVVILYMFLLTIATDILRHAWQKTCNICIIVSGDDDYRDAIDCAKNTGIKVWVASFNNCLSKDIRKTADKIILLDDIFHDIKFTITK